MARQWVKTSVKIEGALGRVMAYEVWCAECKTAASGGKDCGEPYAAKKMPRFFEKRGWFIGKDSGHDRCPSCKEIMMTKTVVPLRADPPREMEREDRRIIFLKLSETYVDENVGYSSGWSDQKIADEFNIPRAWVAKVRDENFGPELSEDKTRIINEGERLLTEGREIMASITSQAQIYRDLMDKWADYGRRLTKLETDLKGLQPNAIPPRNSRSRV